MGKVPRGHSARQASRKHVIKAGQSLDASSANAPKFYQQTGGRSLAPKGRK